MLEKHRTLRRSISELDARNPSLINVPLPVNSIPVVGSLVSPLVGDGASDSTQPSPSPDPQPAQASTTGSGSGGGSSSGNSGGNSGGNGGGNGGGDAPTPGSSPGSGGGNAVPPVSPVSNTTPAASGSPGKPSSSSGTNSVNSGGSASSPSVTGGTGNANALSHNSGSGPSAIISADLGMSTPGALEPVSLSDSRYSLGSGSNTAGPASPSSTNPTAAAVSSGKQLSGGAIAGITTVCLLALLALVVLVIRRRFIARRVERRKQWWFGRGALGGNISTDSFGTPCSPVGSGRDTPASRMSGRSSFATNFDQGLMFRVDSPSKFTTGGVPDPPPMAQIHERNSVLISTGGAVARRESLLSMLSNGSDPDAQYVLASTNQDSPEVSTPMSVRPFSPSESFAFPKPPAPPSGKLDSFYVATPRSSAATLVARNTSSPAVMAGVALSPVLIPSLHFLTTTDPSPLIAPPIHSSDPFAGPVKPEFADIEIIRRPFAPSLEDEVVVHPGDRVRIFQVFDDGWTFVEKVTGTDGERHERGLIPVDCLREAGQALPSFLPQKRVSSYGSLAVHFAVPAP